jgi:proteasome activator subunit 4
LAIIAHLEPDLVLPGVLKRFYPSMQGLLEAHRTTASLSCLSMLMPTIAPHKIYRNHITTLLGLAIPGIDPNDLAKTTLTLSFMITTCLLIPLWNISPPGDQTALASKWISQQMEILETMPGDDYPSSIPPLSDEEADLIARSSTGSLDEWVTSFFNQIFSFLSNMPESHGLGSKTAEESLIPMIVTAVSTVLQALEPDLFTLALKKVQKFITENVYHSAGDATSCLVRNFMEIRPEETLEALLRPVTSNIREEILENGAGRSGRMTATEVLPRDRTLLWHLKIFLAMVGPKAGSSVLKYLGPHDALIRETMELTVRECRGTIYYWVGVSLVNVLASLTGVYILGKPLIQKERMHLHGNG